MASAQIRLRRICGPQRVSKGTLVDGAKAGLCVDFGQLVKIRYRAWPGSKSGFDQVLDQVRAFQKLHVVRSWQVWENGKRLVADFRGFPGGRKTPDLKLCAGGV